MFSTTVEYAIRALVRLAQSPSDKTVLGRQLAAETQVPANYLSKLLLTLRKAGLIEATRGAGGGYRLRKDPAEVRLAEVIHLFDPRPRSVCLLSGGRECSPENPCSAHDRWRKVQEAYADFTENTTLADISVRSSGR